MKLVCVDSDKLTLGIMRERFRFINWEARFCLRAGEALVEIHRDIPHVLITGIQLIASNGYELIRSVRNDPHPAVAGLPIVILSHMQQGEYITKGLNLGANDFITKPFDLVLLERDLMVLTGRAEHGRGGQGS